MTMACGMDQHTLDLHPGAGFNNILVFVGPNPSDHPIKPINVICSTGPPKQAQHRV